MRERVKKKLHQNALLSHQEWLKVKYIHQCLKNILYQCFCTKYYKPFSVSGWATNTIMQQRYFMIMEQTTFQQLLRVVYHWPFVWIFSVDKIGLIPNNMGEHYNLHCLVVLIYALHLQWKRNSRWHNWHSSQYTKWSLLY